MTARTRTTTAPATTAVEAVSAEIARNVKYVGKTPTANLSGFAVYAIAVNTVPLKTKAEQEAFATGNRLAGLRSKWQDDRRKGVIKMDVTFEDYCLNSSGVKVGSAAERTALLAGIATYKQYVPYRKAREAGKLNADGSIKK